MHTQTRQARVLSDTRQDLGAYTITFLYRHTVLGTYTIHILSFTLPSDLVPHRQRVSEATLSVWILVRGLMIVPLRLQCLCLWERGGVVGGNGRWKQGVRVEKAHVCDVQTQYGVFFGKRVQSDPVDTIDFLRDCCGWQGSFLCVLTK